MGQSVIFTTDELAKSAHKFREELLVMPMIGAQATLKHMSGRPGVRGKQTVGELSGSIELGPYNAKRVDESGVTIAPRTLETFLGSVVKEFEPNKVWQSIYGSLITQGEGLKNVNISRSVLAFLAAKLGQSLNMAIWGAVRKENGDKTVDLFNGFDTITATEITSGKISEANKNLKVMEAITKNNAVEVLKEFYQGASDEIQEIPTKLFVTRDIFNAYSTDYQQTVGAVPYNMKYEQTFIEGSAGLCELVPLVSKKNSPFIHLTTSSNMLYGYGDGLADEKITVEKYHAFLLQFIATMYFGVEFETISPEKLLVGSFT